MAEYPENDDPYANHDNRQHSGNIIVLLPDFKFGPEPTFVIACDDSGLQWLENRFRALDADPTSSFVIGDGNPISSDEKCRVTVTGARGRERSGIIQSAHSAFGWHIEPEEGSTNADMIEPLRTHNKPGHQYLSPKWGKYRTVVVTKHEYPFDLLRAMRDGREIDPRDKIPRREHS